MKSIYTLKELKGKTVLLRADFNVPIEKGKVRDDFRIRKTIPTITYLKKKGAQIIIVSHAGSDGSQTLKPVAASLNKFFPVRFITEVLPKKLELDKGEIVLLENIRKEKGETQNDPVFAKKLASYADIYVNDAFSVSHRKHASIVAITKYLPSYAGLQLEAEVSHLSKVLKKPKHPFLFILGGAKFETKLPLIKRFLKTADTLSITGALMNNFFKVNGFEIGTSLVEKGDWGITEFMKNKKLLLPVDVIVTTNNKTGTEISIADVKPNQKIVDIGPESIKEIGIVIQKAKLILWNGPTGLYEEGFDHGTKSLLKLLAKSKAETIIGGGDTTAVVTELGMENKFSFVSTGGGATLEFLAHGTLPGLQALGYKNN